VIFLGIIAFLGAFLQTTLGFGMGIFMMMFLPMRFPYGSAVAISKIVGLGGSLCIVLRLWRHVDLKALCPLTLPCLVVAFAATRLSFQLDVRLLGFLLGFVLLLLSLYFSLVQSRLTYRPKLANTAMVALIAGFGEGFFGIGGPPAALYCMSQMEEKERYLASIHLHFLLTSIGIIVLRVFHGMVDASLIPSLLVGLVAVALGTAIGLLCFKKVPLQLLRRLVYLFVGANGILTMVRQLHG